eukprot:5087-Prymnesium_polylepis.1
MTLGGPPRLAASPQTYCYGGTRPRPSPRTPSRVGSVLLLVYRRRQLVDGDAFSHALCHAAAVDAAAVEAAAVLLSAAVHAAGPGAAGGLRAVVVRDPVEAWVRLGLHTPKGHARRGVLGELVRALV